MELIQFMELEETKVDGLEKKIEESNMELRNMCGDTKLLQNDFKVAWGSIVDF